MKNRIIVFWITTFFLILLWSAINPYNYFTWFLEVIPAIIGFIVLAATYKRFKFTPLVYWLIWIHAIILIVGGHYTYARVPLFDWISTVFEMGRNNYDKVGHFAQGFIPALIAREILIRKNVVKSARWLFFIVLCIVLALSATYEFIEWGAAVAAGEASEDFLGTQGYVWDTQSDMLLALVGSILSLLILKRVHDKQLSKN